MAIIDQYFKSLVIDILDQGEWQRPEDVRARWDDGTPAPAKSVTDIQWKFNNSEWLWPTTKEFYGLASLKEIDWIWRDKSNKLQDLRDKNKDGKSIWDKWEITAPTSKWFGTIGPAYGYQLAQKTYQWKWENVNWDHLNDTHYKVIGTDTGDIVFLDQVDHLIQSLLKGPGSRRLITTLWVPSDIDEMSLTPCVWNTQWLCWNGKLNLTVGIRSNDICVGNPFNVFQYQVLQHQMAQVVGIPVGTITFNITDAHIYDRHINLAQYQIAQTMQDLPTIELNPEIKNFYDFTYNEVHISNRPNVTRFDYEVSI